MAAVRQFSVVKKQQHSARPLPHPTHPGLFRSPCGNVSFFHGRRGAEDVPKTAVITPFGLFEFLHMPFDLKGAAQTFQRLMDSVLQDLDFVFVYLNDILVASPSTDAHRSHLKSVFQRLDEHGLIINLEKCQFGLPVIDFLGHRISVPLECRL